MLTHRRVGGTHHPESKEEREIKLWYTTVQGQMQSYATWSVSVGGVASYKDKFCLVLWGMVDKENPAQKEILPSSKTIVSERKWPLLHIEKISVELTSGDSWGGTAGLQRPLLLRADAMIH